MNLRAFLSSLFCLIVFVLPAPTQAMIDADVLEYMNLLVQYSTWVIRPGELAAKMNCDLATANQTLYNLFDLKVKENNELVNLIGGFNNDEDNIQTVIGSHTDECRQKLTKWEWEDGGSIGLEIGGLIGFIFASAVDLGGAYRSLFAGITSAIAVGGSMALSEFVASKQEQDTINCILDLGNKLEADASFTPGLYQKAKTESEKALQNLTYVTFGASISGSSNILSALAQHYKSTENIASFLKNFSMISPFNMTAQEKIQSEEVLELMQNFTTVMFGNNSTSKQVLADILKNCLDDIKESQAVQWTKIALMTTIPPFLIANSYFTNKAKAYQQQVEEATSEVVQQSGISPQSEEAQFLETETRRVTFSDMTAESSAGDIGGVPRLPNVDPTTTPLLESEELIGESVTYSTKFSAIAGASLVFATLEIAAIAVLTIEEFVNKQKKYNDLISQYENHYKLYYSCFNSQLTNSSLTPDQQKQCSYHNNVKSFNYATLKDIDRCVYGHNYTLIAKSLKIGSNDELWCRPKYM